MSSEATEMGAEASDSRTPSSDGEQMYAFACSRTDLVAGAVRVGDDIDPSKLIEQAIGYNSIEFLSSAGRQAIDVWQCPDWAVIHGSVEDGAADGVVVADELLEFQLAAFFTAGLGELTARQSLLAEVDDEDPKMLLISGGSSRGEGPKTVIVNSSKLTMGAVAQPGDESLQIRSVSAVTAWAMIVDSLRGVTRPDQ